MAVYDQSEDIPPSEAIEYKRLIVCCDGTGRSSTGDGEETVPTNVTRFARALESSDRYRNDENVVKEIPQIVLYQTGVGTGGLTKISDDIAGAFGFGVDLHVLEAYTFFSSNYESGDQLFLFGFSRGAFTARAIASLICHVGLLDKQHLKYLPMIYKRYKERRGSKEKRDEFDRWFEETKELLGFELHTKVEIRHLGLWDTVGSLGVPRTWISQTLSRVGINLDLNKEYEYHDTSFPIPKDDWKGCIFAASQALSIDETRISFSPTLLYAPIQPQTDMTSRHGTSFSQVWFPGVHTDVGGGYSRSYKDMSDITFAWMVDRCKGFLKFRPIRDLHEELRQPSVSIPDPVYEADKPMPGPPACNGWAMSILHDEAKSLKFRAGGAAVRIPGQYYLDKKHEELGTELETREGIHASVRMRLMKDPTWRPAALAGFKPMMHDDGRYYWHRIINISGKEPKEIVLPEWGLKNDGDLCGCLLDTEDVGMLEDKESFLRIQAVPEKKFGWISSLLWN
ncbi:hypothetical protein FRC19_000117 [Serendipita sp. 401]|nr:hypothetical protein FRC15_002452 [Serendipita sp. 397]KAG8828729.1 hypothetical protein FRC19_000117 [Serendipita sp. 401]KAG8847276.1 hypothetical protein FRC20_002791 [Serendipita sp. 405]KAG9058820.1 hypothetical protein FS842_000017 [Serendipita sp. 407]